MRKHLTTILRPNSQNFTNQRSKYNRGLIPHIYNFRRYYNRQKNYYVITYSIMLVRAAAACNASPSMENQPVTSITHWLLASLTWLRPVLLEVLLNMSR